MKINNFMIVILLALYSNSYSQNIIINHDIDTNIYDIAEPLNLWLDFLKTKDDSLGSKYWNSKEIEKYGHKSYFLIENEFYFGMDNYLKILSFFQIKILSIRKTGEYFKIKSILSVRQEKEDNIQYIFHVYASFENGILKLFNALPINTKKYFNSTKIGYIRYYYPKYHKFNIQLANKQNDFLIDLSKKFDIQLDTIDYYFAPSAEEIQRLKGFDFIIGTNGLEIPSGIANHKQKMVFCSGLDEYYPHELVHIFLNPKYTNCHLWINEGVATFLGLSRGKTLDWHLIKLNKHLRHHPEIDLNNMLNYNTLDQYTGYKYVLGGLIIKIAYEKGGYPLIKNLMNSGKSNDDFYKAIEDQLGIKRSQLNNALRKKIEFYCNENNKTIKP